MKLYNIILLIIILFVINGCYSYSCGDIFRTEYNNCYLTRIQDSHEYCLKYAEIVTESSIRCAEKHIHYHESENIHYHKIK
jgi:hypothetical protein